jgi:endonuclease/exonuclease/phosphatase family metal-dependent hydrolase
VTDATADLVVATFNIRNGLAWDGRNSWPFRRRSTLHMINLLDADILGLQEVYGFQRRYVERYVSDVTLSGRGRNANGGGEQCCVMIRAPRFTVVDQQTRWYGDDETRSSRLPGASFPRIATIVRAIDAAHNNEMLTIINTHLDERHTSLRAQSARQLAGWIDDSPTIVVGDFNAVDDADLFDPLADVGLQQIVPTPPLGTAHGFTGRTNGYRIDHILTSTHFDVGHAEVITQSKGERPASDHWPVRATLSYTKR